MQTINYITRDELPQKLQPLIQDLYWDSSLQPLDAFLWAEDLEEDGAYWTEGSGLEKVAAYLRTLGEDVKLLLVD